MKTKTALRLSVITIVLVILNSASSAWAQVNVLTRNYNNQRTGANLSETILNSSNVNSSQFGKLFMLPVDDQVYAGILYVSNLAIAGGTHNVIYVATVNNTVYAFDADAFGPPLWQRNFNGAGRPVSHTEVGQACGDYEDFQGNIGIVGTPVIDASSNTMYFVTKTVENGTFIHRVHAIDITTGSERANSPQLVQASVPGTGDGGTTVVFNPMTENQRAGLSLANGLLYVAWSSHCDTTPYHGWMIAYDPVSLAQKAVFNATPNGQQAAFWQSGAAPAFDASGNLYAGTSNGDWDGVTNFSESVLKLGPASLNLEDWFTPSNFMTLNNFDLDLDSQGPVILPCPPACPTAPSGNLLVIGGKAGTLWLLNTNNLGHQVNNDTQIPQFFQAVNLTINPGGDPALHNTSPAWVSPQGLNVYVWGGNDFLNGYRFDPATQKFAVALGGSVKPFASGSILAPLNADSGGIETVSSNGSTPGTGIVWGYVSRAGDANQSSVPGNLHAFNAETLGTPLWSSTAAGDDPLNYAKGSPPTVANGKVYAASISGFVSVYGLKSNGQIIQDLAATAASNHPMATGSAPDGSCSAAAAFNNSAQGGPTDKWCSSVSNPFLEVDLGGNFLVNRFVTEHAASGGEDLSLNTRAYNIQVSLDGTNFDTVVDVGNNHKSITTDDIPAIVARFVRLNIVAPAQTASTQANIYEFMVFGTPAPTTPDFLLSVSPQQQTIVTSESASYTARITPFNGFSGSVSLSVTSVPAGVTANFSPTSISGLGTSTLNLSTTAATPPGSFQMTVTATSGGLTHVSFINLTMNLFSAGSVQVSPGSLTSFYNIDGITIDNSVFAPQNFGVTNDPDCFFVSCGIDGGNNTYPASLLPSNLTVFGVPFTIGPANAPDTINNITVPLPAGQFATLGILGTAFNGNAPGNIFTVNYSDGTSDPILQPSSDWFTPQNFPGEVIAATTAHRNFCNATAVGQTCVNIADQRPFNVYAYFLPINATKTVASISLAEPRFDALAFTLIPSSSTAPDFGLTATPSSLELLRRTPAKTTITIDKANGFDHNVDLSVQNLPRGVTADIDPKETRSTSTLTLTADSTAHVGDFVITIVGEADPNDSPTRTTHVAVTLRAEPTAPVAVDLSSSFRRTGIVTDGSTFGGGLDGGGTAYSANLLGPSLTFDGTLFKFGPANVPNVVPAANQVVPLPAGKFSALQMLAAGVNGDQPSQSLQVNYSDRTSDSFSQGFNDWFSGANFGGESIAKTMAYRDVNNGTKDNHANVFLYGYLFPINSGKNATGVQLPIDDNVEVLAMSLTPPGCLYALNPSAANALTFNGPFNVSADCGVIVNSNNLAALNLTGTGTLTSESIQVVGGVSQGPTVKVSPAPSVGDLVQPDPFRNLAPPAVGSQCDHTNFMVDDEEATLEPGTYCNGIAINGHREGANVRFKPGTYVLVGGGLTVHGHTKLRGEGVTFFLTQGLGFNYGPVTIDTPVISELSAPTSGPLEGILVFQDPAITAGPASVVKGSSASKIEGALYFRTTGLTYAVPGRGGDFLILVADTLTITGQVIVNNDFEQLGHGSPIEHHRR